MIPGEPGIILRGGRAPRGVRQPALVVTATVSLDSASPMWPRTPIVDRAAESRESVSRVRDARSPSPAGPRGRGRCRPSGPVPRDAYALEIPPAAGCATEDEIGVSPSYLKESPENDPECCSRRRVF